MGLDVVVSFPREEQRRQNSRVRKGGEVERL